MLGVWEGQALRVPRTLLAGHMVKLATAFSLPKFAFKYLHHLQEAWQETLGWAWGRPHHTLQVLETPTKITLRGVYGPFPGYTAPEKTCLLRRSNLPESAEDSADTSKSKPKIRSHDQPFYSFTQMIWKWIFLEVSRVVTYSDHCLCLLSKYFISVSQGKCPRVNLNNSYLNITVN